MTSSQLPSADAAWLHMDSPANQIVVNAVIWFYEPINVSRARELLRTRLVDEFPRVRQRVSEPLGRPPRFEDDPEFDVDQHLHRMEPEGALPPLHYLGPSRRTGSLFEASIRSAKSSRSSSSATR